MADNPIAGLIRAILDNLVEPRAGSQEWEALAMIFEFPDSQFNEAHGYLYLPGGVVMPVAARARAVQSAVAAYTDSYYAPGDRMPQKILLQFDRTSGKYHVDFEETDEDRWKVTAHNWRALREELRPDL